MHYNLRKIIVHNFVVDGGGIEIFILFLEGAQLVKVLIKINFYVCGNFSKNTKQ